MNTHYETPNALRHDARTLAEDARALILATADSADEKVSQARARLEKALNDGRELLQAAQHKAQDGIQTADGCVRRNPYQFLAAAFGAGAVLTYLVTTSRRS